MTAPVSNGVFDGALPAGQETHPRVAAAFSSVEVPVTGFVTTVAIWALLLPVSMNLESPIRNELVVASSHAVDHELLATIRQRTAAAVGRISGS